MVTSLFLLDQKKNLPYQGRAVARSYLTHSDRSGSIGRTTSKCPVAET
jgi:hypothetical protein